MKNIQGSLVTIEGIDGSGKSTLAEQLTAQDLGINPDQLLKTREPTKEDIGQLLRSHLIGDSFNTIAELHLFLADHADHLERTVKPALAENAPILCDRYFDSRCAYQASGMEKIAEDPLSHIHDLHQPWTVTPDLTLLLDVDPERALERLDTDDKFETISALEEIRENYLTLAKRYPTRIKIIDANGSPTETRENAINTINNTLKNRP